MGHEIHPGYTPITGAAVNAQVAGDGGGNSGLLGGIADFFGSGNLSTTTDKFGNVTQSGNPGFLQEGGALSTGLGALQTLGSLWSSFQQNKLAKKTFNFQKQAYQTNLANQTKTFNNDLEGRIATRFATEGKTTEQAAALFDRQKL